MSKPERRVRRLEVDYLRSLVQHWPALVLQSREEIFGAKNDADINDWHALILWK